MIPVIGLGAGGHAKMVIETLRAAGGWDVVGLLDPRSELRGTSVLGVPVLGDDDLLAEQAAAGVGHAFVGVGSTADLGPRRRLYELILRHGLQPAPAVDPRAIVSPSARLGSGPTVMPGAVIGSDVSIGENVIINTGAIVEHDCVVGSHVHVASGARLASTVRVEDEAHVGLGACVLQTRTIGRGAVVGAGAVVVDDVPERTVVAGVPARPLRTLP